MKNLFLVLVALVWTTTAMAQFKYIGNENALLLADRTIIVELLNEKSENAIVDEESKRINRLLKSVVKKHLKIGKKVEVMDRGEIEFALQSKKAKYAFISHKGNRANHMDITLEIIGNRETDFRGKKIITSIGLGHKQLINSDYLFVVQQINMLYEAGLRNVPISNYRDVPSNIEKLSKDTLVISKDQTVYDFDSYPRYDYPIKFVTFQAQVDRMAFRQEKGKAYLKLIWCSYTNFYYWVAVDAETGKILSQIAYRESSEHFAKSIPTAEIYPRSINLLDDENANTLNNPYLTPEEKKKRKRKFCLSGGYCFAFFCFCI